MNPIHRHALLSPLRLLALVALALSACAAPAAAPPTTAPTQAATDTALPATAAPTAAATDQSTLAPSNNAVPATSFNSLAASDVAFDAAGNLYIATCDDSSIIYKVDALGLATRYAGYDNGTSGVFGEGGPAIAAALFCPVGLAFDAGGNLYVADTVNNRIRRIDRNGQISTVAGSGPAGLNTGGYGGDGGPATAALLHAPSDIAVGADGSLYIDDAVNKRIRKVDRQGIITTVAGNGTAGFSGDGGPATAAQIGSPTVIQNNFGALAGIILDAQGNLYFSDSGNARVRKVDLQGIITTIAGVGDGPAVAGDGGPATAAVLSSPGGLAFDAQGNLYIAESDSQSTFDSRVRKIDHNGIITTVAGTGKANFSGDDGPATSATLWHPTGIAFDRAGNLYIADFGNQRVRKVDTNGIITTVAGGHY